MQENAMEAANWALTIFFYGLSWFIAVGSIMILWPVWEYVKKKANEQKLKGEEIIVAQNLTKEKETIEFLRNEFETLKKDYDDLTQKKELENAELEKLRAEARDIRERNAIEVDGIDYESLTTIELKAKAKEMGISGISRLSKKDLIHQIKETIIEDAKQASEDDAKDVVNDDVNAGAIAST